jgi:hypothetical protein
MSSLFDPPHQFLRDFFFGFRDGATDSESRVGINRRPTPECAAVVFLRKPLPSTAAFAGESEFPQVPCIDSTIHTWAGYLAGLSFGRPVVKPGVQSQPRDQIYYWRAADKIKRIQDGETAVADEDKIPTRTGLEKSGANSTIRGGSSAGSVGIRKTPFGEVVFLSLCGLPLFFQRSNLDKVELRNYLKSISA